MQPGCCAKRVVLGVRAGAVVASLVLGAKLMAAGIAAGSPAWVALFALVPLFLAIRLWRPARAALSGALWGASLYAFSAGQPDSGVSPTLLSAALLTLIPAAYASLGALVTRRMGFNPFILGFAWMGVELALGPAGLRTGLLGGVAGEGTVMGWIGQGLGYVLVAFVIASVSASLVSVLGRARWSVPGRQYRRVSSNHGAPLLPQTFFRSPLYAIRPSRPRAPPTVN